MNILCKFRFSTYNILHNRAVASGATPISIYQSSISKASLQGFVNEYQPFREYFQLLPFFVEKFVFNNRKQFVTQLDYFRDANLLQLTCLTHSGVFTKLVNTENIIPVTFADYKQASYSGVFRTPVILDHEMIYYNKQQREFYLFDRQGTWNEVEEVGLSLEKNWDERKFQDEYFL